MEQATKKQKMGSIADAAKAATSSSSDPGTGPPQVDKMADCRKSDDCPKGQNAKSNATAVQEPPALANVAVLKEHFSTFSDLSTVELDDSEPNNGNDDSGTSKISARIFFKTRNSAEKAFLSEPFTV